MKCNTLFITSVCNHLSIIVLHFKFLSYHYFKCFCFHILLTFTFFLFKFSRVIINISYCTLFFNFQIVTYQLNLIIVCETLKKESRAFRNIGKKYYIYS